MSAYKSDFLNILAERGFIHQVSEADALDALAKSGSVAGYIGFDCTAASLHVGSLLPIMMLYWMQQTGHKPIALMGGGTTRVGDPSGKDESRRILSEEAIEQNLKGIRAIFAKFLKFEGSGGNAVMANNADWLNKLNYIDFLRDVGRHFSVNRMLSFDSVKMRLDRQQELSFLEFNYMVLQAYDFVELYKRHTCILQMGGSDQWGNIVNGIDLGRRMLNAQLFALTSPLITTSSGAKMGKTAAGAIWLNPDMLSPYDYWQYWRNTEDGDVARFLKLFTVLPLDEIAKLAALKGAEINEAKKVLATEATALVHGREAAETAARIAQQTFEHGEISPNLPTIKIAVPKLGVLTAFQRAGLVSSTGEARRQIKGGGIRINDVPISDEKMILTSNELTPERVIKLSLGRKKHVLLKMDELAITSNWLDDSMARWHALTSNLKPQDSARFPHGHFAIAYWLQGRLKHQTVTDTLEAVRVSTVRHTGWPEFWVPTKDEIKPYTHEGTVECWLARDGEDHGPAHSDFWRASPDGRLFLVRGHQEDEAQDRGHAPGTVFDITLPTWRVGEALLHAANMASALGDESAEVTLVAEWSGLAGRVLTHLGGRRLMMGHNRTLEDKFRNNITVNADSIATSLPELVGNFVTPLYEIFDFFRLPASLPAEELAIMRSSRF